MSDAPAPGAPPPPREPPLEPEGGPSPPSRPDHPPAAVSADDPVAPATHIDGGSYGQEDYSPAARRSQFRPDQLERPPGPKDAEAGQHSGFAGAEGQEGPATVAGGH